MRIRNDESGFSLVEFGVSMILGAVVAAITVGMVAAVGRSVKDQSSRATNQQTVRTVIADMTRDLRQAIPVGGSTAVIDLSVDRLTFTTLAEDGETPEKVVIERTNCSEGVCDLRVRRYAATSGDGGWDFATRPFRDENVVTGVDATGSVFTGVRWSGSPAQRSEVASCAPGSSRCDFSIVGIVVRATPDSTSSTERAFEIREEVRIRSA